MTESLRTIWKSPVIPGGERELVELILRGKCWFFRAASGGCDGDPKWNREPTTKLFDEQEAPRKESFPTSVVNKA